MARYLRRPGVLAVVGSPASDPDLRFLWNECTSLGSGYETILRRTRKEAAYFQFAEKSLNRSVSKHNQETLAL